MTNYMQKLFATLIILSSFSAFSSSEDDLIIKSEQQFMDYKNNTTNFVGNVRVSQGTLSIFADQLNMIKSGEYSEKLIAKGNPARFVQVSENGEPIEMTANEVVYDLNKRILELKGNAKLKQDGSNVDSGSIIFNLDTQRIQASGDQSTGGRVTTVIKTKKKQPSN